MFRREVKYRGVWVTETPAQKSEHGAGETVMADSLNVEKLNFRGDPEKRDSGESAGGKATSNTILTHLLILLWMISRLWRKATAWNRPVQIRVRWGQDRGSEPP